MIQPGTYHIYTNIMLLGKDGHITFSAEKSNLKGEQVLSDDRGVVITWVGCASTQRDGTCVIALYLDRAALPDSQVRSIYCVLDEDALDHLNEFSAMSSAALATSIDGMGHEIQIAIWRVPNPVL